MLAGYGCQEIRPCIVFGPEIRLSEGARTWVSENRRECSRLERLLWQTVKENVLRFWQVC